MSILHSGIPFHILVFSHPWAKNIMQIIPSVLLIIWKWCCVVFFPSSCPLFKCSETNQKDWVCCKKINTMRSLVLRFHPMAMSGGSHWAQLGCHHELYVGLLKGWPACWLWNKGIHWSWNRFNNVQSWKSGFLAPQIHQGEWNLQSAIAGPAKWEPCHLIHLLACA